MTRSTFEHKGIKCEILFDVEEDNIKKWFMYWDASLGRWNIAPIAPYEPDESIMLWIDLGMPPRKLDTTSQSLRDYHYQELKNMKGTV